MVFCSYCHERWPSNIAKTIQTICEFCKRNKNSRKERYSQSNKMTPSIPPRCLRELNFLETILISRVIPFIRIYNVNYACSRMEGNCINIIYSPESGRCYDKHNKNE